MRLVPASHIAKLQQDAAQDSRTHRHRKGIPRQIVAKPAVLGEEGLLRCLEVLGKDALQGQHLLSTQEAILIVPKRGAVGHQAGRAIQLRWCSLVALGHVDDHLITRASLFRLLQTSLGSAQLKNREEL